jgi:large subunit ribosomal protein L21
MFAVIKTGGKQYRVVAEDLLKVDKVKGEPGEIIEFPEVLVVGGDTPVLGNPTVAGASVAAEVLGQERGAKVIAFKKRRRKNSRRKRGHRQEFTLVRITEILTDGARPTKTARPRPERKEKPAPEVTAGADIDSDEEAASQPKAKAKGTSKGTSKATSKAKASAKKTAAKKPAAKGKAEGAKGKGKSKT